MYFDAYSQFDETTRLTFTAAALQESYLARRAFSSNRSDVVRLFIFPKQLYCSGYVTYYLFCCLSVIRFSAMTRLRKPDIYKGCKNCPKEPSHYPSLSTPQEKEVPYKRFYVAGALHKLISGVPSWRVSAMFKIPRGTLQSALSSAVSHASKLAHFTKVLTCCYCFPHLLLYAS